MAPNLPRDAAAIFPVPAPTNTQRCRSPRGQEPLGQRSCFSLLSSLPVPQPMLPHICLERPGPGRSLLLSEPVPHTASVLTWKTSALATLAILRMYYPIFFLNPSKVSTTVLESTCPSSLVSLLFTSPDPQVSVESLPPGSPIPSRGDTAGRTRVVCYRTG